MLLLTFRCYSILPKHRLFVHFYTLLPVTISPTDYMRTKVLLDPLQQKKICFLIFHFPKMLSTLLAPFLFHNSPPSIMCHLRAMFSKFLLSDHLGISLDEKEYYPYKNKSIRHHAIHFYNLLNKKAHPLKNSIPISLPASR